MKSNEISIIKNSIKEYVKEKNKLPQLDELISGPAGFFFEQIKNDQSLYKEYSKIYEETIVEIINNTKNVKMKKLFRDAFKSNKDLFLSFIKLNYDPNWKNNIEKFNEIGKKIQNIIIDLQNQLPPNTKGGKSQYRVFSLHLNDKFIKYIKIFFPHYDNIGVKISKKNT